MKKLFALMLAALVLMTGCRKRENIDYDNSLLNYDEALTMEADYFSFGFEQETELTSTGTTFVFDEESIQKGYFYIVTPPLSLIRSSPDDAIVEAVYNLDYMVEDTTIRFHTFTMSFEEIGCEFHDITLTTPKGEVIDLSVSDDNTIEQKLDYTMMDNDGRIFQTMFWIKGTVTYEGQDYEFSQHF